MARWCRHCGREKELHELEEQIVADTTAGTTKVRLRLCRLKPKKSRQANGLKRTVLAPDHAAYDREAKRQRKARDKRRRREAAAA